jgi:uncharacterized repeat protein (TIGR01451 family)
VLSAAVLLGGCQSIRPTSPALSKNEDSSAAPAKQAAKQPAAPTVKPVDYQGPAASEPSRIEAGPAATTFSDQTATECPPPVMNSPFPQCSTATAFCDPGCLPQEACMPPAPPVWSPNEYICDGGDAVPEVDVAKDWRVFGLGPEDTVAHYDTIDGHTCVQPSNRVCIYAPRFAAVRKVTGLVQFERNEIAAGLSRPLGPSQSATTQPATTLLQPEAPRGQQSVKVGQILRNRNRTVGLENRQALALAQRDLLPYEDFLALQRGQLDNSQKARLASLLEAAVTWSHDMPVQVIIDNVQAVETSQHFDAESVVTYDLPKGKPRLCVAKCASTGSAKPGDIVQFTIRFQNVGEQKIGNVTLLDNLSSRLEYVEGSEQCSLKANFSSKANDGESLVLRWEVVDPLEVGEGGVINFQCRVR